MYELSHGEYCLLYAHHNRQSYNHLNRTVGRLMSLGMFEQDQDVLGIKLSAKGLEALAAYETDHPKEAHCV